MARKAPKRNESSYNFMDTYGDMMTLLLTFFVLLFAFSSVDDAKWNILVQAFTGSPPMKSVAAIELLNEPDFTDHLPQTTVNLRDMNTGGADDEELEETLSALVGVTLTEADVQKLAVYMTEDQMEIMSTPEYQQTEADFSLLYERLQLYIQENGLQDMLFAERDLDSIYLRVAAGVLFESGHADIRPEAMPILDTLEDIFFMAGDALSLVTVEGHTDNVPISSARFPSNWELSSARATQVGRYIWEKERIPQDMFNVSGYGEFHPVATNDTEEGKQANRRVEFVLRKRVITTEDIASNVDAEGEPPTLDVSQDPTQAAGVVDILNAAESQAVAEAQPEAEIQPAENGQ